MKKFAIIVGIIVFAFLLIGSIAGNIGPDTSVYLGRQIPKKFVNEIKSIGLLEEGEEIAYFYSDAFLDIKSGLYFLTEERVVLFSDAWEIPEIVIYYDDIKDAYFERNESFWEDSYIVIITKNGLEVEFPVSSERHRDGDFFQYIADHSFNSDSSDAENNKGIIVDDPYQ